MNTKLSLLFVSISLFIAGCSTVSEPQKPAPVAGKVPSKKQTNKPAPAKAPPVAKKAAPNNSNAKTYALDDAPTSFKVEPSTSTFHAEPITPAPTFETATPANITPGSTAQPLTATVPQQPSIPQQLVSPAHTPFAIEEVAIPAGTQPAVLALISEADRNRANGDLDASVMVLERALRIDSRNPALTYKLAQLRIKQNKPQLAEELASKAALLAGNDMELKRKSWILIAEARQMQQNLAGAKEAKAKADSFIGR